MRITSIADLMVHHKKSAIKTFLSQAERIKNTYSEYGFTLPYSHWLEDNRRKITQAGSIMSINSILHNALMAIFIVEEGYSGGYKKAKERADHAMNIHRCGR